LYHILAFAISNLSVRKKIKGELQRAYSNIVHVVKTVYHHGVLWKMFFDISKVCIADQTVSNFSCCVLKEDLCRY
jgi:hypothetical protein